MSKAAYFPPSTHSICSKTFCKQATICSNPDLSVSFHAWSLAQFLSLHVLSAWQPVSFSIRWNKIYFQANIRMNYTPKRLVSPSTDIFFTPKQVLLFAILCVSIECFTPTYASLVLLSSSHVLSYFHHIKQRTW